MTDIKKKSFSAIPLTIGGDLMNILLYIYREREKKLSNFMNNTQFNSTKLPLQKCKVILFIVIILNNK